MRSSDARSALAGYGWRLGEEPLLGELSRESQGEGIGTATGKEEVSTPRTSSSQWFASFFFFSYPVVVSQFIIECSSLFK